MPDLIPTTTVIPCPRCGVPVRLAEAESVARCEACNTVVSRRAKPTGGGQERASQSTVLAAGLAVLVAAGVAFWALGRHPPPPAISPPFDGHAKSTALPPSKPEPPTALPSIPAGEIAWIPDARGPLLLGGAGDGGPAVEDVFGYFRVWDGRSAWTTFAGVFRGSTLAEAWRTEPLDPWLVRRTGSVPMALALGSRIVVADATQTLRIYTAAGQKEATYRLAQPPRDMCRAAGTGDGHVWIDFDAPVTLDIDTGKTVPTPAAPPGCRRMSRPSPPLVHGHDAGAADASGPPSPACDGDFQNHLARATCLAGDALPRLDDVALRYAVTDGSAEVALGTAGDGPTIPTAVGLLPGGKVAWKRPVAADATTRSTELVPRLAELANGKLYVIGDKVYFDSRLQAIDVKTGQTDWDVALTGSLPRTKAFEARGEPRSLVVSATRVYVARAGGGLDVFDASMGAAVGTIGSR